MDVFNLIQEEMKKNTEAAKLEKEQALAAAKDKENSEKPEEVTEKPAAKKRSISDNTEDMDVDAPSKKVKFDEPSKDSKEVSSKEKKKKNKKNKSNDTDVDMQVMKNGNSHGEANGVDTTEDTSQNNGEIKEKKKKKKKNKKSLDASASEMEIVQEKGDEKVNGAVETNGSLANGHSKSKKNKKKRSKTGDGTNTEGLVEQNTPTPAENLDDSTVTTKSPKQKSKLCDKEVLLVFISFYKILTHRNNCIYFSNVLKKNHASPNKHKTNEEPYFPF